jgi:transcriptional regulator with XRE-family HTH domain
MVERINLLLKAKNITARQFAEEIGIQPSGMSHIMSGRNNPSLDFVMKVVRRWPEVNINWLMLGKGEMYASVPLNAQGQEHRYEEPAMERHESEQYDLFAQPESPTPPKPSNETRVEAKPVPQYEPQEERPAVQEPEPRQPMPEPREPITPVPPIAEGSMRPLAQPAENCVEAPMSAPTAVQPTQKKKKVVKMIVVYDDHSFAEYYPE